jgi:hypothetical protein
VVAVWDGTLLPGGDRGRRDAGLPELGAGTVIAVLLPGVAGLAAWLLPGLPGLLTSVVTA